jgi:hypothetical protein
MKTHLVQHPHLTREQLGGHSLARLRKHSTIRRGWLSVSEAQPDGRYVLMFLEEAYPNPADLARPWTTAGKPMPPAGRAVVPQGVSLDQATVAKIRCATPQDYCRADFVLEL